MLADRDMVETESDEILRDADKENVALLVVGDPFGYVVRHGIWPTSHTPFFSFSGPPHTPISSYELVLSKSQSE